MATIFVSPGVYTKEQDFSVFASRIGITRLGLVGKTEKGPAFEAIKISSTDEFLLRFGNTNPDLPLTYVAHSFLGQSNELTVSRILGGEGFTNSPAWLIVADVTTTGTTLGQYSGSTLAVIRSKRNNVSGAWYYDEETDLELGNISTTTGNFMISGSTGPLTAVSNGGYTVSLDETKDNYIVKILGQSPKVVTGTPNIYVEKIYPHFIREANSRSDISNINTVAIYKTGTTYTDYADGYSHAQTPWIVSRVIGNEVKRLFKVHTISDGNASNREVKISIANIDVVNYTFNLYVRRYDDTDATASKTVLETWSNLTLDDSKSNFIGKVIGTYDEEYPRKSMFIAIELAESYPENSIPAGFEGYELRGSSTASEGTPANIYYKTGYLSGDSVYKTYLGISELGYTGFTSTQVSSTNAVKTLESDLFVYEGGASTGKTTIKGFHLENIADSSSFVTGYLNSLTAYTTDAGTLIDKNKLKFTLVPYGGFDGWDKYNLYTYLYEEFQDAYTANVAAFKSGIDVLENPEEVDINVFATPGIDYSNNETIIKYALDMVEERTDSLYIVDAPRITVGTTKGTPEAAVNSLESIGIDSNYAATYWPWVQVEDSVSGKYTYQSPTMLIVKALALTDNTKAPWFAPAGLNRGLAGSNIVRADIKLKKAQRDTLYEGRINPMATFTQQGVVVWGQKTLQVDQSALDRINIRRLLLQVRRLVAAASLTLVFEQNDQTLRDQFLSKVEPILLQIQNQRGLYEFKVVMDDSNNNDDTLDRNQLIGKIQLKPTRTMEFLDLTFQVLPTGANFEDF